MSKLESNIGWTDVTANIVTGCSKVSEGCKNCYAESGTRARVLRSQGIETWGPKGVRHPVVEFARKIRRMNGLCICDRCHMTHRYEHLFICDGENAHCTCGTGKTLRRIRLFADSNSDWLDDRWPVETLAMFLQEIYAAPNVDVQLLTKRPENWRSRMIALSAFFERQELPDDDEFGMWLSHWGRPYSTAPSNIWLGVSVENQKAADERIPQLLQIPAAVRFLSCEPLLEDIALPIPRGATTDAVKFPHGFGQWSKQRQEEWCHSMARATYIARCHTPFDWVIVGGESGKNFRQVPVEAIESVAEQCKAAGVPCFVKQDCGLLPGRQGRIPDEVWRMKQFPQPTKGAQWNLKCL